MKTGIEIIAEERVRQIEVEGWSIELDIEEHDCGELADAAACYALRGYWHKKLVNTIALIWPWDDAWWKPTPNDRIKELAKAGALIAAEIDRIQRNK